MKRCAWFSEIATEEKATWGSEAAALAAASRAGVPIAPGFVLSREFFLEYFTVPAVRRGITKALKGVPEGKPQLLHGAAKEARAVVTGTSLPFPLRDALASHLETLEDHLVAVKGSGLELVLTAQTPERHRVHGTVKSLADADKLLRSLYSLSFADADLHARLEEGNMLPAPYPVLVQAFGEPELAGSAIRLDAEKMDETVITVTVHHHEHGKAETGEDILRFDAKSGVLLSKADVAHHWGTARAGHHTPAKRKSVVKADEDQAARVARMVRRAQEPLPETHTYTWARSAGQLFLTGALPYASAMPKAPLAVKHLARGLSAGFGVVSGATRIIKTKKDWSRLGDGDIAVVSHLAPGDFAHLAGAAAVVSESGHAVERDVVRRLGIPGVMGVGDAHVRFKDGQLVTVDGTHAAVYAGQYHAHELPTSLPKTETPITGTRIAATIHDLIAEPVSLAGFDGVGVLRSESILRLIAAYPGDILKKGVADEYVGILAEGIERVARAAYPRPVAYQLHDLSHSLHAAPGRHEPNPTLGFRGAHRLLEEPETMELELRAIQQVMQKNLTNLQLIIPMVRSIPELERVLRAIDVARDSFELPEQVWVRCETPALAIQAEEVCESGVYGLVLDLPALSGLITGLDGGNHQVGHHVDHGDGAVLQALEYAIRTCRTNGIATMLVAEHEFPAAEAVEVAVRAGLTALSVEPVLSDSVRGLVASIEQRMLLEHTLDAPDAE